MRRHTLYIRLRDLEPGDRFDPARPDAWRERYLAGDEQLELELPDSDRAFLVAALEHEGALFEPSVPLATTPEAVHDGARAPRGPGGEVARGKLQTRGGWHVTAEESRYLADKLAAAMAARATIRVPTTKWDVEDGKPVERAATQRCELSADADDAGDRAIFTWLEEVVDFLRAAAERSGFEVW